MTFEVVCLCQHTYLCFYDSFLVRCHASAEYYKYILCNILYISIFVEDSTHMRLIHTEKRKMTSNAFLTTSRVCMNISKGPHRTYCGAKNIVKGFFSINPFFPLFSVFVLELENTGNVTNIANPLAMENFGGFDISSFLDFFKLK